LLGISVKPDGENLDKERKMKKFLVPFLTLSLVLLTPQAAITQTVEQATSSSRKDAHDWQGLVGVRRGTKLRVELKSGRTGEGTVVTLVGSTLTIADNRHIYTLEQSAIQRVYLFKKGSRSKWARIGGGIGTLLGTFIGAGLSIKREKVRRTTVADEDLTPAFAGFFIGALAGAGVGALLGRKEKKELVYEAK
jgi:hypothetical protein